jgi:uncharacterized Zn-finger protein
MARKIGPLESALIGRAIGDPFVASGHPLTCNGGNDDMNTHHDHEVVMLIHDSGKELICPDCGRAQELPEYRRLTDEEAAADARLAR